MMYDLLEQGPDAYVPILLASLLITVIAYGAVPLIVANVRTKEITKRKYRWICYGFNALIMFVFVVLNGGASSGAPYLLWTAIFSGWGLKILEDRGVLEGASPVPVPVPKDGWRCCCGRVNAAYVSSCYCGISKREALQVPRTARILFCRKCGEKLLEDSRFCAKCGTKVGGIVDEM